MRLPRMTTRRWMVAVAAIGLLMGVGIVGYRLNRWRQRFLSRASLHSKQESEWEAIAQGVRALAQDLEASANRWEERGRGTGLLETWLPYRRRQIARLRSDADAHGRQTAYHAALARKYRRAARYPWLPVEPDPPEPE